MIGQTFGHGEDKNQAAQLVSHAILGAVLAYVNNGNPAEGGSAAVASEAAAIYLTNQYKDKKEYQNDKGEFIPNLLPEDVKTQIRDLTAAIGAVVGGTVGDSAFNAQIASVVGQNASENNIFGVKGNSQKNNEYFQKEFACKNDPQCLKKVITENALDAMKYVPQEISLSGNKYKVGDIISNPNDGSGLKYVVVNENGVLKGKILSVDDQVYYYVTHKQELVKSIEDISYFSPGANSVLGVYGAAAGQTLLSGIQLSTGQRVLSGIDGAGPIVGFIGAKLIGKVLYKTSKNIDGYTEVSINQTPLEAQRRLNLKDIGGNGQLKPAEAAIGAQLENVLGTMKKYEVESSGIKNKSPDWEITSGPNKGKTVDAMYTTDNLTQKEIDGLNKFYEKNMSSGKGKQNIQDHLQKADFVPVDFRVLTSYNQKIFLDYIKTLPKSQQAQFIIVR
nr:VENN motif pre-toxin domain-containing protein [Acinetobacter sp. Marseille-Q1620]